LWWRWGYYGSNDNDSSGESGGGDTGGEVVTPTVTATGLKIELDKLAIAATNGQLIVTVRALDTNKGGVADAPVTLSIIDPTDNVINTGLSKQQTDESGNAVFVLKTPATSTTLSDLIKNGFKIVVSTNDSKLSQEQTIAVTGADTTTGSDTTSIVLFDATKTSLNVVEIRPQ
jgi:hypothetical protein